LSFFAYILLIAGGGIIVGALARLALPGKDPMTIWQTMLVGIGGSVAAGLLTWLVLDRAPGIVLSVLFATVIVYFIRRSRGGSLSDPGRPPPPH
jgi:uncharacterized membrane protein YeaQ/YmgE (transglycosylase-associated protein family)